MRSASNDLLRSCEETSVSKKKGISYSLNPTIALRTQFKLVRGYNDLRK